MEDFHWPRVRTKVYHPSSAPFLHSPLSIFLPSSFTPFHLSSYILTFLLHNSSTNPPFHHLPQLLFPRHSSITLPPPSLHPLIHSTFLLLSTSLHPFLPSPFIKPPPPPHINLHSSLLSHPPPFPLGGSQKWTPSHWTRNILRFNKVSYIVIFISWENIYQRFDCYFTEIFNSVRPIFNFP